MTLKPSSLQLAACAAALLALHACTGAEQETFSPPASTSTAATTLTKRPPAELRLTVTGPIEKARVEPYVWRPFSGNFRKALPGEQPELTIDVAVTAVDREFVPDAERLVAKRGWTKVKPLRKHKLSAKIVVRSAEGERPLRVRSVDGMNWRIADPLGAMLPRLARHIGLAVCTAFPAPPAGPRDATEYLSFMGDEQDPDFGYGMEPPGAVTTGSDARLATFALQLTAPEPGLEHRLRDELEWYLAEDVRVPSPGGQAEYVLTAELSQGKLEGPRHGRDARYVGASVTLTGPRGTPTWRPRALDAQPHSDEDLVETLAARLGTAVKGMIARDAGRPATNAR